MAGERQTKETADDDVAWVLALGDDAVAEALLDARLKALKKTAKAQPEALTPILRRRAILAEESAIDDDLPSLHAAARRMGEAAAQPDATDDDRARWAWGLLMANATGKARKAGGTDAMLKAGLAYAAKPTSERRAALFAASTAHPERAVRLVLQRAEPVAAEARALYEARRAEAPLPDRHTLRALRLAVAALRVAGDPEAERLHRLDPEHGLAPAAALALRRDRLAQMEARFGARSELLFSPTFRLSAAAKEAGELALSVELRLRVDDMLAARRGENARVERSVLLGGVRRDLIALRRWDDAEAVIARAETVSAARGLDVPDHSARAELCEARGDWDGALEHGRLGVEQARTSEHHAYGPGSANLRLIEGWQAQRIERVARARARDRL